MVAKSLYLVEPKILDPTMYDLSSFEAMGLDRTIWIAGAGPATVAALAPDDWTVEICDEGCQEVDFDTTCDFVGITGKNSTMERMLQLAAEFKKRGKTVLIGGPQASLAPHHFRGKCDVLVIGELEAIAGEFFADLENGRWKAEYNAGKADLGTSPMPRWDLYPNRNVIAGVVQTSRGCPFECEFCDVIQYMGRKQRHKSVEQVLAELDQLYAFGYRTIFLADDNFTVYRRRARELLQAIRAWNDRQSQGKVFFSTQLSVEIHDDEDMLRLLAEANMGMVFVGIETPNQESLIETQKRQNVGVDMKLSVERFLSWGIMVEAGMIVGFDHDDKSIFDTQYRFAQSLPVPIFSTSVLVAPEATPLYERMRKAGRLHEGPGSFVGTMPYGTNIEPAQMSREELRDGAIDLLGRLYSPESFGQRLFQMIDAMGDYRHKHASAGSRRHATGFSAIEARLTIAQRIAFRRRPEDRALWTRVSKALIQKPQAASAVVMAFISYIQFQYMIESAAGQAPQGTDDRAARKVA